VEILATPIINGSALWKIVLASALGGVGVVIAFGLLVLFVTRAEQVRSTHGGERILYLLGSAVCGVFCLAVVVIGIYAMAKKPAGAKPKATKATAALVARASPRG
jgi:ABC-type Na+ efflux pump permease subunit